MVTTSRPPKPPVVLDTVVDDPESIRQMARDNGPYWQPGRTIATSKSASAVAANDGDDDDTDFANAMVGPTFRAQWAFGEPMVDGAAELLQHEGFTAAARQMYGWELVVPEQVYVNLTTPIGRQGFSHTDIPEFRGVDRRNAPAWLLTAMGVSRLFENERIHIVTAVAWFYEGEAGGFRYWPEGKNGPSFLHTDTWNTAIVGDNDFMPHEVQRVGPRGSVKPEGMTLSSELLCDGADWHIVDRGTVLASYPDEAVRLSLSWKAKLYRDDAEQADAEAGVGITVDEAIKRLGQALDPEPLAGDSVESPALRAQLARRFSAYVPSPAPS
ncbi:MAG: hypothetical protein AAGC53_10565 [Actinomycetota bacterium]